MGAGRAVKPQQNKMSSKQTRQVVRHPSKGAAKKAAVRSRTTRSARAVEPPAVNNAIAARVAAPPPPPKTERLEKPQVISAITWDDPKLDRRIIEGMLTDRQALVAELAQEGITAAAIVRRAADLGLSEAYLRHVQTVAADLAGDRPGARRVPSSLAARNCLSCSRIFLSSGPGNRICPRCRGADAGLAQL